MHAPNRLNFHEVQIVTGYRVSRRGLGEWDAISGYRFRSTQIENLNRRDPAPGSEPGIRGKIFHEYSLPSHDPRVANKPYCCFEGRTASIRRVKLSHSRAATHCYVSDQAEFRPNPCRTRNQAGPWCTQLQILDLPVRELNPLNFHVFFDFPPAKRVLSTRSSKIPRIYAIKNVFSLKGYSCIKK